MRLFITILLLFIFLRAEGGDIITFTTDNATYILREPQAWGAIYKYCIACHSAAAIDRTSLPSSEWQNRVDKCVLYMHSRGYPRPTKTDREALYAFLPLVTPGGRVYMVKPKRGSLAAP
ncbi:MAG: cytochrome c [Deferribacteraceae bacterium]|jgi:hypothetical protein|nr:cytochrome c [Deferribacteraceae bacterium]